MPHVCAHIGARLKRPDDPRLLTGRGRYLDDLTLPRMAHVAFVRSPHAHAVIAGIEAAAARGGPGVLAVLTGPEAARLCKPYRGVLLHYAGMKTGAMLPLATDRARYVGEPVVAVAAESRALAEDAAARVVVRYEPLPAVLTPEQARERPPIHADLPRQRDLRDAPRGGRPGGRLRGRAPRLPSALHHGTPHRGADGAPGPGWPTSSRPPGRSRCGSRPRCRT